MRVKCSDVFWNLAENIVTARLLREDCINIILESLHFMSICNARDVIPLSFVCLFIYGPTAPSGPGSPHSRDI